MEGTLEQKMEHFAINVPAPELKVGQVYKITGGKWKKYKKAKVLKVNKTYSDVSLNLDCVDASVKNPLHAEDVKCKNCYLHPCDDVIEMPDADDLVIVDNSVDINKVYDEQHPKEEQAEQAVEEQVEEEKVEEVVEDITDVLPSIEEALALKEENASLKEEIISLLKKIKAIKNVCDI